MAESEDWLPVGKIVGAQGLKGELKVNPASDFPERFTAPGPRWVRSMQTSEPMRVQLQCGRQQQVVAEGGEARAWRFVERGQKAHLRGAA